MDKDNGVGRERRIEEESRSALDELLSQGVRRMLQAAVEAEVGDYVAQHASLHDAETGCRTVPLPLTHPSRPPMPTRGLGRP